MTDKSLRDVITETITRFHTNIEGIPTYAGRKCLIDMLVGSIERYIEESKNGNCISKVSKKSEKNKNRSKP